MNAIREILHSLPVIYTKILFLATYIHYIRVDHTPSQIMFVGMLIHL